METPVQEKRFVPSPFYNNAEKREQRKKEIISYIEEKHLTLEAVGSLFGLTRERVRQIYTKATGHGTRKIRKEITDEAIRVREEARLKQMKEIKCYCKACGAAVYYKDRSRFFCPKCKSMWKDYGRDPCTTFECLQCGTAFHPYRNWKSMKKPQQYCSMQCYRDGGFFPPFR